MSRPNTAAEPVSAKGGMPMCRGFGQEIQGLGWSRVARRAPRAARRERNETPSSGHFGGGKVVTTISPTVVVEVSDDATQGGRHTVTPYC